MILSVPLVIIFIFNIFFIKKITLSLSSILYSIGLLIGTLTSDLVLIISSVLMLIGIISYKLFLKSKEIDLIDFSERSRLKKVLSVSYFANSLKRYDSTGLNIGRVVPTKESELKYNNRLVVIDNEIQRGSMLVSGASGSGKSYMLKSLMKQKVHQGHSVFWADMKGDVDILDELKDLANRLKIKYYEFSIRDCNFSYDPFENLNETGKVEAFMNTRQWSSNGSDAHYKTSTQLAIQNIIRLYDSYRVEKKESKPYLIGLYDCALGYRPDSNERDGHQTFIKQLEIILTSKAKELFSGNPNRFSFEKDEQYIICFSFVSANKSLANTLLSFVFQDLLDRGIRRAYKPELMVCVDEFGTVESPTLIKDLLEKGRSGGCQTVFSILDVNQIAMSTNEYFVNAILGTINNFIIFAGATQKTAELLASVQKFDNKDFDIMSLRKPYQGRRPTALVISKFPIIDKRYNQSIYRIEPFIFETKVELKVEEVKPEVITLKEEVEELREEIKIVTPRFAPLEDSYNIIDNIDDYL